LAKRIEQTIKSGKISDGVRDRTMKGRIVKRKKDNEVHNL